MIVKNGLRYLCGILFRSIITNYTNIDGATFTGSSQFANALAWKVLNSNTRSITNSSTKSNITATATSAAAASLTQIFLGTDDTPVTVDDHTLGNFIELDTTPAQLNLSVNNNVTISQTFTNNTGEVVTIKELGLFPYISYSSSGSATKRFMMAREVLSTPITIGVGESKGFSMTLDFSEINNIIS